MSAKRKERLKWLRIRMNDELALAGDEGLSYDSFSASMADELSLPPETIKEYLAEFNDSGEICLLGKALNVKIKKKA